MRRKEWGPRRLSPALRGGKGIAGSPRALLVQPRAVPSIGVPEVEGRQHTHAGRRLHRVGPGPPRTPRLALVRARLPLAGGLELCSLGQDPLPQQIAVTGLNPTRAQESKIRAVPNLLCQFAKRRRPCPPESIGFVVQERVGGFKDATLAGAHLPRPPACRFYLPTYLGSRGSRGGYPLAALGSEDWCNPSHGGVFSGGRPSVHGVATSPTAPASSRVSRE